MVLDISVYIILISLGLSAFVGLLTAPFLASRRLSLIIGVAAVSMGAYFLNSSGSEQENLTAVYNLSSMGLGLGLILKSLSKSSVVYKASQIYNPNTVSGSKAVISVSSVTKNYFNGVKTTALKGVDLKINKGEFVAIMGPSGSGKSTLMHILGLLDTPTSGSYRLAGKEVSFLKPSEQAQVRNNYIGFVFQQFNLLPRTTVLDNVLLPTIYNGATDLKGRALEIINKVGLDERVNHKSNQLSGGQIQRVAIARALMMNPHIILADEPTGNLDSKTSAEIMSLFRKINGEGTTIVMVTHEEDIARYANRIIKLKDGLVVSDEVRV